MAVKMASIGWYHGGSAAAASMYRLKICVAENGVSMAKMTA